ncbi:hypothetical protein [Kribbella italica]|uniref:Uncharacterized protein n=1 Tax=Kribbella italica TaxID=1540520 RepID=A0A7W9JG19_9ACTN|nr:hypothetical protein [Kribbella italica]MBB5841462.1 hypothetical protein [Kribbella italica]
MRSQYAGTARRAACAAAAAGLTAGLLAGCTSAPAAEPSPTPTLSIPSTVGGTVPVPTIAPDTAKPTDAAKPPATPAQATAPPPAAAGPVSSKNLPPADKLGAGWKTFVDEGGAEAGWLGNKTWTRERSAHQAAYEALPVGCAGRMPTSALPVPLHALQATYRTGSDLPATALLLRFADQQQAEQYYTGYQTRMTACGTSTDAQLAVEPLWSEQDAAAQVRRYAGAEAYAETVVRQGSTVALLAAQDAKPSADWAHSVVPALRAVIDSA